MVNFLIKSHSALSSLLAIALVLFSYLPSADPCAQENLLTGRVGLVMVKFTCTYDPNIAHGKSLLEVICKKFVIDKIGLHGRK